MTLQQLRQWMDSKEDEHLEFKKAENNFHFEKLVKYCAAIANENGGEHSPAPVRRISEDKPARRYGFPAPTLIRPV